MSERKWAAIVYGRSYHLDFRFIAIPEDFGEKEISWASKYIFATTRKARNLPAHPRWSLFKNETHCAIGVTCMVRDLVSSMDLAGTSIPTKDNRGRPLYIFVGYVTQLNASQSYLDFPTYTEHLQDFANLYQYVRQVWTIEDYHQNSKKPIVTKYQTILSPAKLTADVTLAAIEELNHQQKQPDRVFFWQSERQHDWQLWLAAAVCPYPISLCLNINSDRYFSNSPFLNQTLTSVDGFTIKERIATQKQLPPAQPVTRSLSKSITNKVKSDLELTIYHANYAATLGQELVENFTSKVKVKSLHNTETEAQDDFGFKYKKSTQDNSSWF
ncbi:hypothetical protein [Myxosarcina sp. GI1]|uniref:hypothetical protein n=1 Tax=Myxosarcina sp. GI1 TaxID=1541065 RepID=UPI0005656B81|nr:hypothetical protein [Myxosarcina sp. GI1]